MSKAKSSVQSIMTHPYFVEYYTVFKVITKIVVRQEQYHWSQGENSKIYTLCNFKEIKCLLKTDSNQMEIGGDKGGERGRVVKEHV